MTPIEQRGIHRELSFCNVIELDQSGELTVGRLGEFKWQE